MNVRSKNSNSRLGKRVWLTATLMDQKFGPTAAGLMRERKESNPDLARTEIKENPDLPGLKVGHLDVLE